MSTSPRVFISATSGDLRSIRQVVKDALLSNGCHPVEQTHFEPDWRTLADLDRQKIEQCQALVHLVGLHYGAEPDPATLPPGTPRRSYTQMEYDTGCQLQEQLGDGRFRVYVFVCPEDFPYDAEPDAEPEEKRALQRAHRAAILAGPRRYETPRDAAEIERRILALREEVLAIEREQAEVLAAVHAAEPRATTRHEQSMAAHASTQGKLDRALEGLGTTRHADYLRRLAVAYSGYDELGWDVTHEDDARPREQPVQLLDIFIPPTASDARLSSTDFDAALARGEHPAKPLLPQLCAGQSRRTVLLADPGMGKSTLIRWLIVCLATRGRVPGAPQLDRCLPLPFIVRDLVRHLPEDPTQWKWDALLRAFRAIKIARTDADPLLSGFEKDDRGFHELLDHPKAFFLIDGLDEIGDPIKRAAFRDAVLDGFKTQREARWLVTSRVVGYDSAPLHEVTGQFFAEGGLNSATRDNTTSELMADWGVKFIKWDAGWEFSDAGERRGKQIVRYVFGLAELRYLAPWDDSQQDTFALGWFAQRSSQAARDLAEELLREVRDPNHAGGRHGIRVIARVPNLLLLMALLKLRGLPLPHGRAQLYAKIVEAYLQTIPQAKKYGAAQHYEPPCDFEQARRWLSTIGIHMQLRRADAGGSEAGAGEVTATEAEILGWLEPAIHIDLPQADVPAVARRFLGHVAHWSGLLQPRGEGEFGFAHLSFLEYFAACYLGLERERLLKRDARWAQNQRKGIATSDADLDRDYPPGPVPFREEDFPALAAQAAWHEVLVFFVESRKTETRDLLRWLFPSLHTDAPPPQHLNGRPRPLMPSDTVNLAAALARDRHLAIEESQRRTWWRRLWGAWLDSPFEILDGGQPDYWNIAPALLAEVESCAECLSDLVDLARQKRVTGLNLRACGGLRDLTPLQGLSALRELYFGDCTGVSDLTPLQGLSALQELFLRDCTGVSEEQRAALRRSLPRCHVIV